VSTTPLLTTSMLTPPTPKQPAPGTLALAPRRELVWKSRKQGHLSLDEISQQFRYFLRDFLPIPSNPVLQRRRGRYSTTTPHRCPGYNREEITLTPEVSKSAIVSHLTPTPHEICLVCGKVVRDAEPFHCVCGKGGEQLAGLILLSVVLICFIKMTNLNPLSSAQAVPHTTT